MKKPAEKLKVDSNISEKYSLKKLHNSHELYTYIEMHTNALFSSSLF